MEQLLFSSLPIEQFKSDLREAVTAAVRQEVHTLITSGTPVKEQEDYPTRREAAKLLRISLPTLNDWTKKGVVTGYRIGSRVRYKRSELEAALKQIRSAKERRAA